eukprot:scaffold495_cov405-Prasinococcus_capsulatus_cf.AAC.15
MCLAEGSGSRPKRRRTGPLLAPRWQARQWQEPRGCGGEAGETCAGCALFHGCGTPAGAGTGRHGGRSGPGGGQTRPRVRVHLRSSALGSRRSGGNGSAGSVRVFIHSGCDAWEAAMARSSTVPTVYIRMVVSLHSAAAHPVTAGEKPLHELA